MDGTNNGVAMQHGAHLVPVYTGPPLFVRLAAVNFHDCWIHDHLTTWIFHMVMENRKLTTIKPIEGIKKSFLYFSTYFSPAVSIYTRRGGWPYIVLLLTSVQQYRLVDTKPCFADGILCLLAGFKEVSPRASAATSRGQQIQGIYLISDTNVGYCDW
eukprot:scaffold2243_cov165-Amphora_coffeaeformis.AAC.7